MADAGCRELPSAVFFPNDSTGVAIARRVCAGCPVKDVCLEYALANRLAHGIWGGTSEQERVRNRRRRIAGGASLR